MSNKSVSLFEVLPPKGNKKSEKKGSPVAETKSEGSPTSSSEERKLVDPPKATERKTIDDSSFGASAENSSESSQGSIKKESVERPSSEGDMTGVSAQKREDHFWLIALIMLGFSVVIGVACYRYGYKKGVGIGFRAAVAQQETPSKASPASSSIEMAKVPVHQAPPTIAKKEILPTRLAMPTPEMKKAVAPLVPPKRYTLQVQTMGRNQRSATDALVVALKKGGFEAFADYREGAVFVGRLEKSRGDMASVLKKRVSRFNYHNLNFSRAYFRPIPKHLLEN